jgi:hypothetical protein
MGRRALAITPLLLLAVALLLRPASAGSRDILNGSVAVQSGGRLTYQVPVGSAQLNPRIVGRLVATGGTGNDIIIGVMTDAEYVNYANGHQGTPLYYSGQVTVADVRAALPGPGTYVVFLDNNFSAFTPKTVEGRLQLGWDEPPPPSPEGTTAKGSAGGKSAANAFLLGLAGIAVLGAIVGGLLVWAIMTRMRRG